MLARAACSTAKRLTCAGAIGARIGWKQSRAFSEKFFKLPNSNCEQFALARICDYRIGMQRA
jgi:hypothetical protein